MNQIERDGDFTFLNLNEFRFNHPFNFIVDNSSITEYYKNNLTECLVEQLSVLYNTDAKRIILINGGDQCLDVLIRYFGHMEAVIKVPTYGVYKTLCELYKVKYNEVSDLKDNYFKKLVFICNPNNPTGEYFDIKQLAFNNPSSIFVIDETYIDFSDKKSMCSYNMDNVFIIRSMSKYYGLAGVRIGCIIGDVDKMRHIFNNKNVLDISKSLAIKVLQNKKYYDNCADIVKKNKERIVNVLIDKKIEHVDTSCNFICVKGVKNLIKAREQNLIFRDISTRINCSDMYRITIGSDDDADKTVKFLSSL
jgi:histidinol-phosphate aminotransferase